MDKKEQEQIRNQQEQYERQFGSPMPNAWQKCKYCGKPYGEHYGANCPACECTHAIEVWNSEPKDNPVRVAYLKKTIPELMAPINHYYQDGEKWYSLQCRNCGRIIHVPA